MLYRSMVFFFAIFTLFTTSIYAEEPNTKEVVMVTVYDVYSEPRAPVLRLIITGDMLQKPVGEFSFLLNEEELANIETEKIVYHENLFHQVPQEFINGSNYSYSSPFDGGGNLIFITFSDGSHNEWGIFLSEDSYSEEIQSFLKKINDILRRDVTGN